MTASLLLVALGALHRGPRHVPRAAPASQVTQKAPGPPTPTGIPIATAPPTAPDWSGPDAASAKASKTDVRLGEPFDVIVEVKHARGESWSLDPRQKLAPFALLGQSQATEIAQDPIEVTRLTLKLALFKLDQNAVPALDLVARDAKGVSHAFSLPGPTVKGIAPDLGKDHQKRDIHNPVPVTVKDYRPLWLALGVLAALALAVWGFLWWRRRPRRERAAPAAPPIPADEAALAQLGRLEEEGLPAKGRFKEFHLRLSLVLRSYLEVRYSFSALDMTSTELLDALGRRSTEGLQLADISWICMQGDLAKFAKAQPSADDCKQALSLVRQTVIRTRVRPTAAPGAQAGAAA
ncbi:MAG TPA: hypothetical protein VMB50_06445 [Myxococcales bacterium]|nr:hypothetical protein [Myxococcales bacterium]